MYYTYTISSILYTVYIYACTILYTLDIVHLQCTKHILAYQYIHTYSQQSVSIQYTRQPHGYSQMTALWHYVCLGDKHYAALCFLDCFVCHYGLGWSWHYEALCCFMPEQCHLRVPLLSPVHICIHAYVFCQKNCTTSKSPHESAF